MGACAGALAAEERGEDLRHRAESPGREIGRRYRRQRRRGRGEHARPAEVVEVVAGPLLVATAEPEAGDRAVDGAARHVCRPDPEPRGDAGPERLEDDVGAREQRARELAVARQLAEHRFLAGIQAVVPRGRRASHQVAARLLDADDLCPEASQLARGERARQLARQVDDERPLQGRSGRLHSARSYHYPATALGERSTGPEEKRRQILDAAVRVFARKGFHTSRVGDIAEEAGVAHGLLYHYFSSKDEVLETVFRENWGVLLERIHAVEESGEPAREQLRHVAAILLRTWLHEPDVVRVLVREIARSPEVQERIGELVKPLGSIRRMIERGQKAGELRPDVDPALAAIVFYGGIDELLTGWVLGQLPAGPGEVAAAEQTVVDVVLAGFSVAAQELGEPRNADVSA